MRFPSILALMPSAVFSHEMIGSVYLGKNFEACLIIKHDQIDRGQIVDLVGGSSRKYLGQGKVSGLVDSCGEKKNEPGYSLYEIQAKATSFDYEVELVAFLKSILSSTTDSSELTLTGQKPKFEIYQCTSNEGVHLLVREKKNPSKIAYHRYIYMNYDLEASCKESDFMGIKEEE